MLLLLLALLPSLAAAIRCPCPALYECPGKPALVTASSCNGSHLAVAQSTYVCTRFLDTCGSCYPPPESTVLSSSVPVPSPGVCALSAWRLALLIVLVFGAGLFGAILCVFGHLEASRARARRARAAAAAAGYADAVREAARPAAFGGFGGEVVLAMTEPAVAAAAVEAAGGKERWWEKLFWAREGKGTRVKCGRRKDRRRLREEDERGAEEMRDSFGASTDVSTIVSEDESPVTRDFVRVDVNDGSDLRGDRNVVRGADVIEGYRGDEKRELM